MQVQEIITIIITVTFLSIADMANKKNHSLTNRLSPQIKCSKTIKTYSTSNNPQILAKDFSK